MWSRSCIGLRKSINGSSIRDDDNPIECPMPIRFKGAERIAMQNITTGIDRVEWDKLVESNGFHVKVSIIQSIQE